MKRPTSRLTPSRKTGASPPPPKLNLHFDVCAHTFGHYPWDDWERFARARGLDAETAGLGRLLIRSAREITSRTALPQTCLGFISRAEAYNHGWEGWLQSLCGWSDDGQALLAFALREPEQARWCFSRLMDTDGLRGDYHPETKEWTWGFLRLDTRRVLSALHNGAGARPPGDAGQSSIVNPKS